jgi:hypothetical protein
MSDTPSYEAPYRENPFQGTSGRVLRPIYGDPETGQGSLELDVVGRGMFGDTGGRSGGRGPDGEVVSEVDVFDSSRCAASRYYYPENKLFMTWTNGKTPWIYHEVPVTVYSDFVSSSSKGKFVNSVLNLFTHNKLFNGDQYSQYVYGVMPSINES